MTHATQGKPIPPRYLGSPSPDIILYLPNPPLMPASGHALDVVELINLNGNHWRKIFTIFAKLSAPDDDWRRYRDSELLTRKEAICFDDSLIARNARHIVAGKASWVRLGLDQDNFHPLDDQQRSWQHKNVFLTPYLDYRQFPNALIAQLKPLLS